MAQYKIKKGDTLSQIAKDNGTDVKTLQSLNGIKDVNKIYAGSMINLPETTRANNFVKLSDNSSSAKTSTPGSAPTLGANPTLPTYDTSSYGDSSKGIVNWDAYQGALDEVNKHGDYVYGNQEQLDAIMDSILNREKFSYDLNGDALYQQYKDKYIQQGKMAMADTMGQAAALTGGYGNSYAQSVGQQAYQAQLQNLNDIVPELYQMALDKYNMEGQDLLNKYGMLTDDYDRGYGRHQDSYNKKMDMLGIARSDYYDGANMFYTEQGNKNDVASKQFDDAMTILNRNDNNSWMEAEWNRDQTWRDEDIAREDSQRQEDIDYRNAVNGLKKNEDGTLEYVGGSGNSGGSSGSGSKGSGSGSGTNSNGGSTTTSAIPDSVKEKASTFTNNDALDAYLTKQYEAGNITEEQMGQLYLENEISDLNKRNWTLVDDGGINWFWGIDGNAKVKDQYGNTYTMDKLVDALVSEGMSKSDAKDYVKKLQNSLGA